MKIKIHDKKKLQRIIKEEREAALQKKSIFVLVGPPSVGKSTWIKSTFKKQNPYVISRDDVVNQVVSGMGWTYDDMFVSPPDPGMCRPVNKKEKLKNADQIKDESGCASAQPESVKRKWVLTKLGDVDKKFGTVEEPPAYVTWQRFSYSKVAAANNKVHQLFTKRVAGAQPSGRDVVVDMTNMNARARKGAMQAIEGFEGDYKKVAIVFGFEGAQDLIKRVAAQRAAEAKAQGRSKTIPAAAFDRMFKSFQEIDPSEGFDQVVSVDNAEALSKVAPTGQGQQAGIPGLESEAPAGSGRQASRPGLGPDGVGKPRKTRRPAGKSRQMSLPGLEERRNRLTKRTLQRVIKEELRKVLPEGYTLYDDDDDDYGWSEKEGYILYDEAGDKYDEYESLAHVKAKLRDLSTRTNTDDWEVEDPDGNTTVAWELDEEGEQDQWRYNRKDSFKNR